MSKQSLEAIAKNPEYYNEVLTRCKFPRDGYHTEFDNYFPDRPTEGCNIISLEQFDPIDTCYLVLWHVIETGEYPITGRFWK